MKVNEGFYAILIGIAILAATIVPYTVLRNVEKWYGSFLFWTVLTNNRLKSETVKKG